MPPHDPQRDSDAFNARTQVQSTEAVAASVALSIPPHVRQHASAPKLPGYVLAEPLGEGAYGQVWRAWQLRTRKEVAVKVFLQRSGLDWIFLQREVERLTRLDKHPHIVTLLDTNLDEEPPFYVMELLGGGSLQQCVTVSAPADPRRALRWMTQIVDALSYVHAKGLIHCDLKPANILLDEGDNIRVVDFGQSRVFTESAASLGTLFYMAPEQAIPAQVGTPIQPDVRWDIYAFGATLYAILTGRVPYSSPTNAQQLERTTALPERLADYRKIIERDPRPPWEGCSVNPEVRAVIDKCMSPDAAKRYGAVAEVAADLQAIEQRRPVTPLAGSKSYRTKKFVQRNRGLVAAVAAVILALIAGLVGTGLMYAQAVAQRDRAQEAELLTQESLEEEEQARNEAEQVTKFLTDTLAAADPSKQGKDVTVREVLDQASEKISQQFADAPLIQARLQKTVGSTYRGLGLYDRAKDHLADAAETYRRVLGERDRLTLAAMNDLAVCIGDLGKYSASEASQRSILEIRRRVLGEEHTETLGSMGNLANALKDQARYSEAEELYRKTLEIHRRTLGEEHRDTLISMNNLAGSSFNLERFAEAEELFRKTLEIQLRVLSNEHPDTLMSMSNLALVLENRSRYAEAEELNRNTLETRLRVLGGTHPDTLASMSNLANVLHCQDRYAEAEELHRKTLEVRRRVLGEEHSETLKTMNNLGLEILEQGRSAEAEELFRKTLEIQRRVLPEGHPQTLESMGDLGTSLSDQGRHIEAEELAKQALAAWEERGEPIRVDRWLATSIRGGALTGLGRFDEAEPLLVSGYEAVKDRGDVSPADKRRALGRVIRLYESWDAVEPGKGYADKAALYRRVAASP